MEFWLTFLNRPVKISRIRGLEGRLTLGPSCFYSGALVIGGINAQWGIGPDRHGDQLLRIGMGAIPAGNSGLCLACHHSSTTKITTKFPMRFPLVRLGADARWYSFSKFDFHKGTNTPLYITTRYDSVSFHVLYLLARKTWFWEWIPVVKINRDHLRWAGWLSHGLLHHPHHSARIRY